MPFLLLGPPFRFNFEAKEDSFIIDIYNETESIMTAIRVDFLITPSSFSMDSSFIHKLGIILYILI
jgi:hypothetical protein